MLLHRSNHQHAMTASSRHHMQAAPHPMLRVLGNLSQLAANIDFHHLVAGMHARSKQQITPLRVPLKPPHPAPAV
eukprot:CAMPEP_0183380280 /NCGR_PEP_ID=MMETSP0164_2-20130417/125854_1 /TAXON_ID=221442 /ORGANISM="Coccolithus pelagicus ssp braarudi, Strain PLY182g" /LENGTH=74 /DNA_ID=CAMNT_0025557877 /DNA_START=447 /DNA_END=672 /DNA_ORIENTATION=+